MNNNSSGNNNNNTISTSNTSFFPNYPQPNMSNNNNINNNNNNSKFSHSSSLFSKRQPFKQRSNGITENMGKALFKMKDPKCIMIVAKAFEPKIVQFTSHLALHLVDQLSTSSPRLAPKHTTDLHQDPLIHDSPTPYLSTAQSPSIHPDTVVNDPLLLLPTSSSTPSSSASSSSNSPSQIKKEIVIYVDEKLKSDPVFGWRGILEISPLYERHIRWWSKEICCGKEDDIDFIISLGGDGTVLYTSWLFQNSQVPPVIPFHLGSLGFLTNCDIVQIRNVLDKMMGCKGEGLSLNMRMRLKCTVWTENRTQSQMDLLENVRLMPVDDDQGLEDEYDPHILDPKLDMAMHTLPLISKAPANKSQRRRSSAKSSFLGHVNCSPSETFHILNDIVIDRGPSPYMSQLEIYVDDKHLTTVQADGLVVAAPTGSTAYSLSAGGSLVHPQVPCILVTPICPHTLSFRPMLLPDNIELKIEVPADSRSTAWVSFDGRHRVELMAGDYVIISLSPYSMPTICAEDTTTDWFQSLRRCLHWNQRARQKEFGTSSFTPQLERAKLHLNADHHYHFPPIPSTAPSSSTQEAYSHPLSELASTTFDDIL